MGRQNGLNRQCLCLSIPPKPILLMVALSEAQGKCGLDCRLNWHSNCSIIQCFICLSGRKGSQEPGDIFLLIRLGVWGGTQPPLFLDPGLDFPAWQPPNNDYDADLSLLDFPRLKGLGDSDPHWQISCIIRENLVSFQYAAFS